MGDASPPTADVVLPPTDGGACNALEVSGAPVFITEIAADPPPFASNGTPPSTGLYQLTALTIYTGPNGSSGTSSSEQAVARFSSAKNGFVIDSVSVTDQEAPTRESAMATFAASGELQFTPFCPQAGTPSSVFYSFDGKTLTFRLEASANTANATIEEQLLLVGQ